MHLALKAQLIRVDHKLGLDRISYWEKKSSKSNPNLKFDLILFEINWIE